MLTWCYSAVILAGVPANSVTVGHIDDARIFVINQDGNLCFKSGFESIDYFRKESHLDSLGAFGFPAAMADPLAFSVDNPVRAAGGGGVEMTAAAGAPRGRAGALTGRRTSSSSRALLQTARSSGAGAGAGAAASARKPEIRRM